MGKTMLQMFTDHLPCAKHQERLMTQDQTIIGAIYSLLKKKKKGHVL